MRQYMQVEEPSRDYSRGILNDITPTPKYRRQRSKNQIDRSKKRRANKKQMKRAYTQKPRNWCNIRNISSDAGYTGGRSSSNTHPSRHGFEFGPNNTSAMNTSNIPTCKRVPSNLRLCDEGRSRCSANRSNHKSSMSHSRSASHGCNSRQSAGRPRTISQIKRQIKKLQRPTFNSKMNA